MDDILRQLFATSGAEAITWQQVVLYLLSAFVLAQLLAWVYVWTQASVSFSRSHVQSIVLLAVIVTAVMLAIGNNIARAFGLFGALALIRFRTPVKDSRDTTYLFMSVGIGIALGTRSVMLAVIGTLAFAIVALYLRFSQSVRESDGAMLRFSAPADGGWEDLTRRVLRHYCRSYTLVHLREPHPGGDTEHAYRVRLFDQRQSKGLMRDLAQVAGLHGLSLLVQREHEV